MPVGLEELYHGVKIATDVTYQNTYQFPEKNAKLVALRKPPNKNSYYKLGGGTTIKNSRPNFSALSRANQQHLYDMTKASYKELMDNGVLRRPRSHNLEGRKKVKPIAHLLHIPPSTPQPWSKVKLSPFTANIVMGSDDVEDQRWTPVSLYSPQYDRFITSPSPARPISARH